MGIEGMNIRATNVTGPNTVLAVVMHLDSDPGDTGSIVAVRDADILTLRTRDILIDGEGQEVAIASHGLLPS